MSTVLVILIALLILLVGFVFYKLYDIKLKIFEDFSFFVNVLQNKVIISQESIENIIDEHEFNLKESKTLLKKLHLKQESESRFLTKQELKDIKGYLNLISSSFGEQSKEHITAFKTYLNDKLIDVNQQRQNKGVLGAKLSIIVCAAFIILCL